MLTARERRTLFIETSVVAVVIGALCAKMLYVTAAGGLGGDGLTSWSARRTGLASISSAATLLLAFSPLFFLSRSVRWRALWTANLILTVLILADVLYVRYFGDVLSVAALSGARQLGMISESILALMKPADALLFADLAILAIVMRPGLPRAPETVGDRRALRRAGAAFILAGGAMSAVPVITILRAGEADYHKLRGVARIGLLNYHAYDVVRHLHLRATAPTPTQADFNRVRAFLERQRDVAPPRSELFGIARGRNVIMIMVEALQAFPIGLTVNGSEVTPNLHRFARGSMVWDGFYDQTWHGVTSDGEFSALQALHPIPEGGVPTRYGTNEFLALPRILGDNGYSAHSAHGYSGAIWMMATIHRKYGFQQTYFRESFEQTERIGMGLSDDSFFRQMVPRLQQQRRPFLSFLVTLSTHYPYRLAAADRSPQFDVPAGSRMGAYLQSVHHFDRAFGVFVAELDRTGLLDESIVILFGDHRAAFGDRSELIDVMQRYGGYPPPQPPFDPRYWLEERRLPLLIRLPGGQAAGVRPGTAGQVDIAPTLLGLLGIAHPPLVGLGRDLTEGGSSLVVFRDGSFVHGDTLCARRNATQADQCRNWRTGAALDDERMRESLQEARTRLDVSDILITGDLIPWAAQVLGAGASARTAPDASRGAGIP